MTKLKKIGHNYKRDEHKALILGSALAMDHYKLNGRMMNDSDLRIPESLLGAVIPDTIGSSIRRF